MRTITVENPRSHLLTNVCGAHGEITCGQQGQTAFPSPAGNTFYSSRRSATGCPGEYTCCHARRQTFMGFTSEMLMILPGFRIGQPRGEWICGSVCWKYDSTRQRASLLFNGSSALSVSMRGLQQRGQRPGNTNEGWARAPWKSELLYPSKSNRDYLAAYWLGSYCNQP
jgi:hypothetical protein